MTQYQNRSLYVALHQERRKNKELSDRVAGAEAEVGVMEQLLSCIQRHWGQVRRGALGSWGASTNRALRIPCGRTRVWRRVACVGLLARVFTTHVPSCFRVAPLRVPAAPAGPGLRPHPQHD